MSEKQLERAFDTKLRFHTFRVNIAAVENSHGRTEIYLDDKPLRGVKSITIIADTDKATTVQVTMIANVVGAAMVAETEGATA